MKNILLNELGSHAYHNVTNVIKVYISENTSTGELKYFVEIDYVTPLGYEETLTYVQCDTLVEAENKLNEVLALYK